MFLNSQRLTVKLIPFQGVKQHTELAEEGMNVG
jgi:hypothetical protein